MKLFTAKFKSGGLHEKYVVARSNTETRYRNKTERRYIFLCILLYCEINSFFSISIEMYLNGKISSLINLIP